MRSNASCGPIIGEKNMKENKAYGQFTRKDEVRFVRLLPGPIERVWTYLTDSEKRGTWLAKGSMDLRVGGRVELKFHHADFVPHEKIPDKWKHVAGGHGLEGRITRCEPPRVLSFTWPEEPGDNSEVTFELAERGEDVELVLTHRRLPNSEMARGVAGGWHAHLGVLAARLAEAPLPPFWGTMLRLESGYRRRLAAAFPEK